MTVQKLWELASVQSKPVFSNNVNLMNATDMDAAKKWLENFWDVANEPMKDFIARTGLTTSDFSTQNNINARTVQHWVAGERSCPQYVRFAYARLYGLIDTQCIESEFCDF